MPGSSPHPEVRPSMTVEDVDTTPVAWGDGEAPGAFTIRLEHQSWPAVALLRVRVDPDRGPIVVSVSAEAPDVVSYRDVLEHVQAAGGTADFVRRGLRQAFLTLSDAILRDELLEEDPSRADLLRRAEEGDHEALAAWSRVFRERRDEHMVATLPAMREAAGRQRRRRRLTDALLREVVQVHRAAAERGDPERLAVADHFGAKPETVSKWITAARARHLFD